MFFKQLNIQPEILWSNNIDIKEKRKSGDCFLIEKMVLVDHDDRRNTKASNIFFKRSLTRRLCIIFVKTSIIEDTT